MTFPPTQQPTARLLQDAARAEGSEIQIKHLVVPEAYDALLGGRPEEHDPILFPPIAALAKEVDAILLAQVSLVRLLPGLQDLPVPVFPSLSSSLRRIQELFT